MPLVGDVRQIRLARLLEVLAAGRRSGLLNLRAKGGPVEIYLRGGYLQQACRAKGPGVMEVLLAAKTAAEDREALRSFGVAGETSTVLLLEFFGLSSREEALASLREQALATLGALAGVQKAEFCFDSGAGLPADRIGLNLPLREALRRLGGNDQESL